MTKAIPTIQKYMTTTPLTVGPDQTLAQALKMMEQIEDAMAQNPYTVAPDAPLDQVAEEMAEKKYGSAVVVQNHKVVGIFTAVDGLAALAELLSTRLK